MHIGTVFFLLVYMPFYILSLPMALAKFSIVMLVRMGEHLPCFIPDLREKHTDFYPLVWCQLQAFYRCSLSNYRSLLYFMLFWHFFLSWMSIGFLKMLFLHQLIQLCDFSPLFTIVVSCPNRFTVTGPSLLS